MRRSRSYPFTIRLCSGVDATGRMHLSPQDHAKDAVSAFSSTLLCAHIQYLSHDMHEKTGSDVHTDLQLAQGQTSTLL